MKFLALFYLLYVTNSPGSANLSCVYKCPSNLTAVPDLSHQQTANGCGPKGLTIDASVLPKPEMELCCNEHDFCYDTCLNSKKNCDEAFKTCLMTVCSSPKCLKPLVCKVTANLFYDAVRDLGCISYLSAQTNSCLCQ